MIQFDYYFPMFRNHIFGVSNWNDLKFQHKTQVVRFSVIGYPWFSDIFEGLLRQATTMNTLVSLSTTVGRETAGGCVEVWCHVMKSQGYPGCLVFFWRMKS